MNVIDIYVKIPTDCSNVIITYQITSNNNNQTFNSYLISEFQHMNRPYDEFVVKSMTRLVLNCQTKLKKNSKKDKKKKEKYANIEEQPCTSPNEVVIKYKDEFVTNVDKMKNHELRSDMLIYSDIFCFKVIKNAPNIISISTFPKQVISYGCMIVPQVNYEFANDFQCVWLCEKYVKSNDYTIVSNDKCYTPLCMNYIGCRIKIFCTPIYRDDTIKDRIIEGKPVAYYLSGTLQLAFPILNKMLEVRKDFNNLQRTPIIDSIVLGEMKAEQGYQRVISEELITNDEEIIGLSKNKLPMRMCNKGELRVLSYNILAEPYATSNQAIKQLFRYCNQSYLQTEYRMQRVLLEILDSDADIICLQECDFKVFQNYFLPVLGQKGYSGHFTSKTGLEGCAIFTYNITCKVKKYIDLPLKKILREAAYLEVLYQHRPDLIDIIGGKLGTICQLAVVESVIEPNKCFIVANTHLFYHPSAGAIRLLQLYAITQAIESLISNLQSLDELGVTNRLHIDGEEEIDLLYLELEEKIQTSLINNSIATLETSDQHHSLGNSKIDEGYSQQLYHIGVILMGDFNSTPETAAIEFLTKGYVSAEKWLYEWHRLQEFYWGGSENNSIIEETNEATMDNVFSNFKQNVVTGTISMQKNDIAATKYLYKHFTHQLHLFSAAGYPKYSNYTADFKALLDYIMVSTVSCSSNNSNDNNGSSSRGFKVLRVAPFPEESILSAHTALPSKVIPSDHLAVIVDIQYIL